MAKTEQHRAMSKRVLTLDTRGLEIEIDEHEEIRILIDSTVSLPFKAFDIIEAWAKDLDFNGREAEELRFDVAEFVARKLDEKFLLARLR